MRDAAEPATMQTMVMNETERAARRNPLPGTLRRRRGEGRGPDT